MLPIPYPGGQSYEAEHAELKAEPRTRAGSLRIKKQKGFFHRSPLVLSHLPL